MPDEITIFSLGIHFSPPVSNRKHPLFSEYIASAEFTINNEIPEVKDTIRTEYVNIIINERINLNMKNIKLIIVFKKYTYKKLKKVAKNKWQNCCYEHG